MDILKDGKIDTSLVKPGDYIQIFKQIGKLNGVITRVSSDMLITRLWVENEFVHYLITAGGIQLGEERFIISPELSGAAIGVNMPEITELSQAGKECIDSIVNGLDWNESNEDRAGWS